MTPAEKNQLLQFMGQTYGHIHQQDQMIVGQAGNLKPGSQELKQSFETAAKLPVQEQYSKPNVPGPPPAPAQAPPVEISTVTPEQAAEQLALPTPEPVPPQPTPEQVLHSNQLELDLSEPSKLDKIIEVLKEQNLLLKQISLKLDNGKKAPNKKSG
tara:strand:- start:3435 stop:3902 length:468 start_codon:yes stop_codon:yes gene_type:complete